MLHVCAQRLFRRGEQHGPGSNPSRRLTRKLRDYSVVFSPLRTDEFRIGVKVGQRGADIRLRQVRVRFEYFADTHTKLLDITSDGADLEARPRNDGALA